MELSPTTQLPRWYNYAALPVALSTMALHQLIGILRETRGLLGVAQ
jgi:C4-dicarboxylate transporter, DctQ subunit